MKSLNPLLVILWAAFSLSAVLPQPVVAEEPESEDALDSPFYDLAQSMPTAGQPPTPPLVALPQLLAAPERFVNQEIRVCGFVMQYLENGMLYASEADYEHGMRGNAMPLKFDLSKGPLFVIPKDLLSFNTLETGYYYVLAKVEQKPPQGLVFDGREIWSAAGFRLKVQRMTKPSKRPADFVMTTLDQTVALQQRLESEEGKKLMPDEMARRELSVLLSHCQDALRQSLMQAVRKEPDLISPGVERVRYGKDGKRMAEKKPEPAETSQDPADPFAAGKGAREPQADKESGAKTDSGETKRQ